MTRTKRSLLRTSKTTTKEKSSASSATRSASSTIYRDFTRWDSKKRPKWHPVKKMRYVFYRMIGGCTVTDALAEIRWNASEFWHLVDLKRHAPFREEYKRAKILQGRAFADSVVSVAEGRDRTTRRTVKKLDAFIQKGLRRAGRQKSSLAAKAMLESLLARIDANEHGIIARNKLQIDSAKWMAKTANPQEFSEQTKMSLRWESGATRMNTPSMNPTKTLLAEWQAKARCVHTQSLAYRLWDQLKDVLTDAQRSSLTTTWNHAQLGEGWTELDREYLRVMREISQ